MTEHYPVSCGEGTFSTEDGVTLHHSVFNLDWLRDPKVIFDVGAYDFGDSVRFKKIFPNCNIYSFELSPDNFNKYQTYAKLIGINAYNLGISDTIGSQRFYESTHSEGVNSQGSLLEPNQNYKNNYGSIVNHNLSSQFINVVTIESFCLQNGVTDIDLVHIDVEGAEYQVIKGFGVIRPKLVFAEFLINGGWNGQKSFQETLDLLSSMDYVQVGEYSFDRLFALKGSKYDAH